MESVSGSIYPISGYSKIGFTISHMTSLHTKAYEEVIDRLKKARIDAGFTQIQAAQKLGKPQSFISKVENRQRRLDVLEIKAFAKLYGVELEALLP